MQAFFIVSLFFLALIRLPCSFSFLVLLAFFVVQEILITELLGHDEDEDRYHKGTDLEQHIGIGDEEER